MHLCRNPLNLQICFRFALSLLSFKPLELFASTHSVPSFFSVFLRPWHCQLDLTTRNWLHKLSYLIYSIQLLLVFEKELLSISTSSSLSLKYLLCSGAKSFALDVEYYLLLQFIQLVVIATVETKQLGVVVENHFFKLVSLVIINEFFSVKPLNNNKQVLRVINFTIYFH